MARDDLTTVEMLFDLAQVTMSSEELEAAARIYPSVRAQADALYREDLRSEAPALAFDPLRDYA